MAQTAPETVAAPDAVEMTLDEFCLRKSTTDRRVELLGGFHFVEKAAGHVKDLESAFELRLQEFANKPVA